MTAYQIREMTGDDVDAVGDVTAAGNFGDRREFFRVAVALSSCRPIVAMSDGHPIGTGLGSIHGGVGWVGVIFVSPELRGRGIGRALTEAACEILDGAGCHSLVLVATELGRPIYERMGFREQTRYHMHPADYLAEMPAPPPGAVIRPILPADLESVVALDRQATGEERRPLIDAYASRGWLLADDDAAACLRGYLLPTFRGNAALIAPRAEDALCLMEAHRHLIPAGGTAWTGLLTENEPGRRLLAERGRTEWRSFPRMVRGPEPDWQPETIWGQFNHAMG